MDMPDEIKEILAFLKAKVHAVHAVGSPFDEKWVQVAELKPEDKLKWKAYALNEGKRKNELETLMVKGQLIKAEHDIAKAEIWNYFYKTYDLPPDESYKVDGTDKRIMRRIEKDNDGD